MNTPNDLQAVVLARVFKKAKNHSQKLTQHHGIVPRGGLGDAGAGVVPAADLLDGETRTQGVVHGNGYAPREAVRNGYAGASLDRGLLAPSELTRARVVVVVERGARSRKRNGDAVLR